MKKLTEERLTPEEGLGMMRLGYEIMVSPYDDSDDFVGITINDFTDESEEEIIEYLKEKKNIEIWYMFDEENTVGINKL